MRMSFVQKLPLIKKKYRHFLPIFSTAIERFNLEDYDLVLSSSHCVAKGVITGSNTLHVCYCFTPMRSDMTESEAKLKKVGIKKGDYVMVIMVQNNLW